MLTQLTGINFKLIGLGIAAFAIIGVITAGYFYVDNLQETVIQLQRKNTKLEQVVQSKNQQIQSQKQNIQTIKDEIEILRKFNRTRTQEIQELTRKLDDREYQERQARIRKSEKASLYLRIINNKAECQWQHFDDFDGKCTQTGNFKEDKK